jgi:twinkle protein
MKWIDHDWDQLAQFETIYLAMDMDEAGEIAAKTISDKLGKARCRRVKIGKSCNDVNELLCSGKGTSTYFEGILSRAKTFDPPSILGASDGIEDAIRENEERLESIKVKNFVFPEMDFKLIDADTGILTGQSGSGKTDLANLIMLNEMEHGQVVCIVAADTPANDLRILSAWQIFGHSPDAHEIRLACEAMEGKLFFIDAVNHRMGGDELLKTMEYATQRYGVTRFLIDNLFEVDDIKKDDYNKQDQFVRDLDKFDKTHRTNSMLVAHALMGDDHATKKPTLRDIEGSKGMTKPIQYAISIFRNRVKENPAEFENGDQTPQKIENLITGSDAYFNVFKCRNGFRKELSQGLEFDVSSRRFRTPYGRFKSPFEVSMNQENITLAELEDQDTSDVPF